MTRPPPAALDPSSFHLREVVLRRHWLHKLDEVLLGAQWGLWLEPLLPPPEHHGPYLGRRWWRLAIHPRARAAVAVTRAHWGGSERCPSLTARFGHHPRRVPGPRLHPLLDRPPRRRLHVADHERGLLRRPQVALPCRGLDVVTNTAISSIAWEPMEKPNQSGGQRQRQRQQQPNRSPSLKKREKIERLLRTSHTRRRD